MRDEPNPKPSSKTESEVRTASNPHPSRNLEPRSRGYGIGGGYEKPYRKQPNPAEQRGHSYGPVPHSGYYGAAAEAERFELGQAGYKTELPWYALQYGEKTSDQPRKPK